MAVAGTTSPVNLLSRTICSRGKEDGDDYGNKADTTMASIIFSAAAVQGMLLRNEEISQKDDDRDFVKETAATAQDNVVVCRCRQAQ